MESPGTDPLLHSLAAGDQRAFAVLHQRFARRLYWVALSIVGRAEDAEDAVQDVFMAVIRSRDQLTRVQDLTAYLFASLRRTAGRRAARNARDPILRKAADEPVTQADSHASENPHSERLSRALAALPPAQREVIALKIDGELTFAEIAEVLGVSINTAASRYRYALEKLRTSLEGCK